MSHRSNPRPLLSAPTSSPAPEDLQQDLPESPPTTTRPATDDAAAASSASADELAGAHLESIELGEDLAGEAAGAGGSGLSPPAPAVLSREQFASTWCAIFNMGSAMTGLRSLSVEPADVKPRAIAAAHAVYDIAEETPALRFLIEPGNVWVQRAFVIGAFAVPMGQGVRHELRARRAKPVGPDRPPAAANDNRASEAAADRAPEASAPDPFAWAPPDRA